MAKKTADKKKTLTKPNKKLNLTKENDNSNKVASNKVVSAKQKLKKVVEKKHSIKSESKIDKTLKKNKIVKKIDSKSVVDVESSEEEILKSKPKNTKPKNTNPLKAESKANKKELKLANEDLEETFIEAKIKAPGKNKSVVSIMEEDGGETEVAKAEKTSKVKPIKIDRGNLVDEKAKWNELQKKYGKEKAPLYKMSDKFEAMAAIQHKVLGWGFILSNENDRLEVLFEAGIRMLISNYKS